MKFFGLHIKAQLYLLPLVILVIVAQIVLGGISASALSEKQPVFVLGVQQLEEGGLSDDLSSYLGTSEGIEVIMIPSEAEHTKAFQDFDLQGIVVIPERFSNEVEAGKQNLVEYYPAPGIVNNALMIEHISDSIIKVRAELLLAEALRATGIDNRESTKEKGASQELVKVAYVGPTDERDKEQETPVFEVAALLLLLAVLYAAAVVPSRENKGLRIKGRAAYFMQYGYSLAVAGLVWLCLGVVYFAITAVVFHAEIPPLIVCAFMVLLAYALLVGGALAQVVSMRVLAVVFAVFFVLNMTVGGGLWGQPVSSLTALPVLPLYSITLASQGNPSGIIVLFLLCMFLIVLTAALILRNSKSLSS